MRICISRLRGKLLSVGIQNFHFNNFDEIFDIPLKKVLENRESKVVSTNDFDNIYEYLATNNIIDVSLEDRLVVVE